MGAHVFEPRKLAGAAAVALLHLLIIAMLLRPTQWHEQSPTAVREIIVRLIAPQRPQPEQSKPGEKKTAPPKIKVPANSYGYSFTPPGALPAVPPSGLNLQLFGCAPDQLAGATAQQRAACAQASLGPQYDPSTTDYRDHTDRSKNAAQWFRDRARKNAPFLLPCMSPAGWSPLYTAYCLAKSAVTGKIDPEDQPGYQDMPNHIANEGDTRMAPQ